MTYKERLYLANQLQGAINTYENEQTGEGYHGKIVWDSFDKSTVKKYYGGETEWYHGVQFIPTIGNCQSIFFRGTDSNENWRNNFDIRKISSHISKNQKFVIPYGNENSKIRMSEGVVREYSSVREMVRRVAKTAWKGNFPVTVSGHSLGGANAEACYIDLLYYGSEELDIPLSAMKRLLYGVGFDGQAIGNAAYRDSFNRRSNGNFITCWMGFDVIHYIPLEIMGYYHVGKQMQVFSAKGAGLLSLVPVIGNLSDHDPRRLMAAIKDEDLPMPALNSAT